MFMIIVSLFSLSTYKHKKSCPYKLAEPRSVYCSMWVCGHDWSGGGWMLHWVFLGIRAELAFFFPSDIVSPLLSSCSFLTPPFTLFFFYSGWSGCSYLPLCLQFIISLQTCHSPWTRGWCFYQTSLVSTIFPFFFPSPPLSTLPRWVTSLPLGSLTPLLWPWPWPCPPWVIYHGPGGEPPGLQAPVSPCNRLFVAPSKQVSDQQKSIKAWWAFLSQLGSGHWAALLAAPRALCVAAVRWHRSPQD